MRLEFSRHIFEKLSNTIFFIFYFLLCLTAILTNSIQIQNFKKIRPMAAELFYADARTDGQKDRYDEANSRFRNFATVPRMKDLDIDYGLTSAGLLDP